MIKLFSILVVLFPFLHQFGLPIEVPFLTETFSIGQMILLPLLAVFLLGKVPVEGVFGMKPVRLSGFFFFSIITVICSLVGASATKGSFAGTLDALVVLVFLCVLLLGSRGWFNIAFAMKAYSFFAVLFSIWLIVQFALLRAKGLVLTDCFDFGSYNYIFDGAYLERFRDTGVPASLFLSPDAFALWATPALAYLLLWNRSGYAALPFVSSVTITAALFLSESALGILLAAVAWFVYLIVPVAYFFVHPVDAVHRFVNGGAGRVCLQLLTYLVVVILFTLYLLDGTFGRVVVPHFRELFSSPVLSSGINYVSDILTTTRLQMCGVGIGNAPGALAAAGIADASLNTIGAILLSSGLIGIAAFCFLLISLVVKRRGKFGFTIAAMLFIITVFVDVAYTPIFGFWFLIAHYADSAEMPMRKYMRL